MVEKYSRQREALLKELNSRCDHPTADTIYLSLRERIPNISLGTVYRNLSKLAESGKIQQLHVDGPDHFDGDIKEHSHFFCKKCDTVFDVAIPAGLRLEDLVKQNIADSVDKQVIQFYGTCKKCVSVDLQNKKIIC
ncbi:MAG: transcriptional repressor [Clostridia bacterium]